MRQSHEILKQNDLIRTSCREEIVNVIANSATPLSEEEIKASINSNFDRTTFYRTFKTLLSKSIIHKIVIDNTLVKYALTHYEDVKKKHAHFYCIACNKVFCIPQVQWEFSDFPDEFSVVETELLIKGYCSNCK